MKKTVAILLAVLMVISSISCIFTVSAETAENLFSNGDFAEYDASAGAVNDWFIQGGGFTPSVTEGNTDNLPEGENFNILTFNKGSATGEVRFYNYKTVKLNTNTSYSISYWIKTKGDAKGMRIFLYEPKYIKRDGSFASGNIPYEGQNIYSYSYDNGSSTRVARKEIHHTITDSRNSFIRNGDSSMASFQNEAYPSTNEEWVQITHTFTTGNDEYHVANVRYGITIPDTCEAEYISLGGFEFYATPVNATVVQGSSNNYDLGTVEPRNGALVENGKATLNAVPFGTNKFLGWYQGGKLVSTAKAFTFDYDSTVKYEAKFEAAGEGVADSHESYTDTLAKWTNGAIDNSGSNGAWVLDSTDGSTWTSVKVNTDAKYVRSGSKSAMLNSRYSYAGRNFTGLKTNTDYTLTFYSYMDVGTGINTNDNKYYEFDRRIERAFITDKSTDIAWTAAEGTTGSAGAISSSDSRVLGYKTNIYGTGRWEKITISFNSGSSTDITLWLRFTATSVTGQSTDGCYIDDISLVEVEKEVKDQNNDPTLWTAYNGDTTTIGPDGILAGWVGKTYNTTDGENIYPGKEGVMHFTSTAYQKLTTLLNVEKNTDYVLNFKYKSPDAATTSSDNKTYHLSSMIILPVGGSPKISHTADRGDPITVRSYNYGYMNKATSNNYNYTSSIDPAKVNEWHAFTLDFNSGEYEELVFVMSIHTAQNIYLCDFNLIKAEDFVPEETVFDFEDPNQWERYAHGKTYEDGPLASDENTWHKIAANTTKTDYIKDGDISILINPQSQTNLIKLKDLKPNTNYMLKFSYITDAMQNSAKTPKDVMLAGCGIWNYGVEGANFKLSSTASKGYLTFANFSGTYYDIFYDDAGNKTFDYYSRRITKQEANTWYDKTFYFNSGDVFETLALVIVLEVENVYFDSFSLISLDDETEESAEYFAPALNGKSATGVYNSKNATHTLYSSVTEANFEGYKTTLIAAGFAEYATNAYGSNKFATYTKGNTTVHLSFAAYNSTMLITEQVTDVLPNRAEDNVYTNKGFGPHIIQLDHNGASGGGIGMSYAIRLADGSFIIVDGGHTEKIFENADRIYNILKEYTPEEKPVIAAWIITHGHDDHIGAFSSFIEKYNNDVIIEEIIFNFATLDQYAAITNSVAGKMTYISITPLLLNIKAFLPNTKVSTCHTGYKYNIRNAVIDIMYTLEDNFPKVLGTNYTDINDTCTTYKISFIDENVDQTLLITGDSAVIQCAEMLKKYPNNELESTFVQAIHHGIAYGSYALYGKMNPEVVLWPASASRLMSVLSENQNSYFVKENSVKEVVCSDYGTRVFALPYTAPEGLTGMSKFTLPAELDVNANPINSYIGVSIRQAGESGTTAKQALRFKFQIPEHIVKAHTEDGYSVAEYGMMVSESNANLNYYEGSNAYVTTEDGTKVFKGVAYNKAEDKNIVFDYVNYPNSTNGTYRSVQYTCALYNIGGLSNGTTDYTKYDTTYYVRSYITFKNVNGDTKVYYGDAKEASVFAVMKAILESTATDEQTASDKTYVKNFLDGKVADFEADAAAIKEAWTSDSTRASLYTPAN